MLSLVMGIKGIFSNSLSKYALEFELKQTKLQFSMLAGRGDATAPLGWLLDLI